jgi:hypothetical protein
MKINTAFIRQQHSKRGVVFLVVVATLSLSALSAHAGGTITFGEDKSLNVGFGMRSSFSSVENGAPNGTSDSQNFSVDSTRIYLSGSLNKHIKGMLNTEKSIAGQGFQAIDSNVQIAITPELTIWAGRFLSPSDRANMAGPYYSLGGGYWSGIASRYGFNGGFIGRDEGVAVVGSLMDGKLAYSFGAFEGNTAFQIAPVTVGPRTGSDALMYAGRLQVDFWDAEPGYYGTGNYLGGKDILAVGVAGRSQKHGAVSTTTTGNYKSYSVDFLLEKKGVGPGALSVEAAGYNYDTSDVFLSEQGKAFSAGLGYIFNEKVGGGQFQPFVRYQKFSPDTKIDTKKSELGVNYIIDGYNAQVGAVYSKTKVTSAKDVRAINVALQVQF